MYHYMLVINNMHFSQTEQIVNEFKVKALACHPDKHPENPKAGTNFFFFCANVIFFDSLRHIAQPPKIITP